MKSKNDKIHYAGRVFDEKEILNLKQSADEFQLTNGHFIEEFEKKLCNFLDIKYSLFVNSGSSANLLAFMALTSHELGDRRIKRGDEVITVACTFPTTISPILNYGAVPVFCDVDLYTANIRTKDLEKAISEKTKAVFIAHTLGNPFDINIVLEFCKKYNLWLVEDNCDALGSKYLDKYTGTFGHIGTSSFFPAHHICTGQGGATYTNDTQLYKIMKSLRSWGREYKCNICKPDCNKRFKSGYDCRYSYSSFGYNLEATEMQASIGCAQLDKLESFNMKRHHNWNDLKNKLEEFSDNFLFQKATEGSDPSWFCFLITIREDSKIDRNHLIQYLEKNNIETRCLFAGNILKQKCMSYLQENIDYKVIGDLPITNYMMNNSFFIGCYPGIKNSDINYIYNTIKNYIEKVV